MPKDRDKKTFEEAFDSFRQQARKVSKPRNKEQEEWLEKVLEFAREQMKKGIRER